MPLVRIDAIEGVHGADRLAALGEVVYQALLQIGALEGDRFQILSEHPPAALTYGRDYLGIVRTDGIVIVQITLNAGRLLAQKKALYAAISSGAERVAGIRPEDVLVNLVETDRVNWSFGLGEAQYATDPS